ncbi:IclR family transcriptional regulator [Pseudomonas sp. 5P_3.1_Bac2]|uniref:IclR family transcriptional regulator n=1 Tax=Pseudomonas sp. 5P_3.1_Bac2 TaxID=2971617 RepID=UPI0021C8A53E|nr:IclR family transcriptional regulator [Pseudomonas sp. 5P_3.1_Bac2]MCU1717182.1 IclR family transcriptional regulator [Pseudomonas sp. 5P_3.1_Bac2]
MAPSDTPATPRQTKAGKAHGRQSEKSAPPPSNKQKVQSAEVGTDILKALAQLSPATSLSRLAEHVGMPASKVHRYLQALLASGFARQDSASSHYSLGREALLVGLAALDAVDVLKLSAQALVTLRDTLNESCFLAVWGNHGPTVVQVEQAVRAITVVTQVGSVLPLLGSASGLVFAAHLPAAEVQALREAELAQQVAHPLADAKAYEALMASIREQGVHAVHGLLMPGVEALAAPIFDARGEIAAVLTVVGTAGIFKAEQQGSAAAQLRQTSQAISWEMGYRV